MRRRRGLSMEALARLVDTSASQINKLEKGQRRLTDEWLLRLANALDCGPADLIAGAGAGASRIPGVNLEEHVFLPVCALTGVDDDGPAAGLGHFLNHAGFRLDLLRSLTTVPPERLAVFVVDDDSMEPTMRSGDHVLAECVDGQMRRDGIYIVEMGDSLAIKRIVFSPEDNSLKVRSDNPIYPSHEKVGRNRVKLIGRVIWMGRRL